MIDKRIITVFPLNYPTILHLGKNPPYKVLRALEEALYKELDQNKNNIAKIEVNSGQAHGQSVAQVHFRIIFKNSIKNDQQNDDLKVYDAGTTPN